MEENILALVGIILAAIIVPISTIAMLKVGAVGLSHKGE